jgi:hypothetical protein
VLSELLDPSYKPYQALKGKPNKTALERPMLSSIREFVSKKRH